MSQSGEFSHGITWLARAITYLLRWYLVAVEIILGMAFVLLLFGANQDSEFVRWVYRSADSAMGPFRGIFNTIDLSSDQISAVFDTSILFAMVAYSVVLMAVDGLIAWLSRSMRRLEVQNRLDEQSAAYRRASSAGSGSAGTPPDVVGQATQSAGSAAPSQAAPQPNGPGSEQ